MDLGVDQKFRMFADFEGDLGLKNYENEKLKNRVEIQQTQERNHGRKIRQHFKIFALIAVF